MTVLVKAVLKGSTERRKYFLKKAVQVRDKRGLSNNPNIKQEEFPFA